MIGYLLQLRLNQHESILFPLKATAESEEARWGGSLENEATRWKKSRKMLLVKQTKYNIKF